MDSLPADVLHAIAAQVCSTRDLAALACCSKALRGAVRPELERRGISVRLNRCRDVLPAWRCAHRLVVLGMSMWAITRGPQPRLWLPPAMPELRRLDLMNPRYPDGDFWPGVFGGCPRLRVVKVVFGFNSKASYQRDVHHAAQLVQHGATVLHELDVKFGGLLSVATLAPVAAVPSGTLRKYSVAFPRAGVQLDFPLPSLTVDGAALEPHAGPRCVAGVEHLEWRPSARHFDPLSLEGFARLRHATVSFRGVHSVEDLERCLGGLRHLPPSLESLEVCCDTWGMRGDVCRVSWGRPLLHLHGLRRLRIHMAFPPTTLAALLGDWMGAGGDALRSVEAGFDESATDGIEDDVSEFDSGEEYRATWEEAGAAVDGSSLVAWLEARPGAVATITQAGRLVGADHPRARLVSCTPAADC